MIARAPPRDGALILGAGLVEQTPGRGGGHPLARGSSRRTEEPVVPGVTLQVLLGHLGQDFKSGAGNASAPARHAR